MKKFKTYIFDLDGTLCDTPMGVGPDGKAGPQYYDATPYTTRIKKVNDLYIQGHHIIIETARGNVSGKDWTAFTKTQIDKWGIKYDKLRVGSKFAADFYIDDKGVNADEYFK
jgi:FMN phosphatase YigB (HAD superfamily)